ncbi:SWEET sugar transporter [Phytophthora cactorum]|nr:SWEET sugar transporter [Phytophthora cactorum]
MTGWMTALQVVTTIGQVMLSLSLGPDMYNIRRRKSIGEMPRFHLSARYRTPTFALYCAVTLYFVLVVTGKTDAEASTSLGYFGLVFSVGVFASPLGTLKRVIKTKSAISIPVNIV